MKRTLITSALPYANGYLHLGHIAGAYLPADMYARFLRLSGEEMLYICGSDEHGVAINISAEKEGKSPKEIIDKYHESNKKSFEKLGITFDIYSRTSKDIHHETAREFFKAMLDKNYLSEKKSKQFYDPKAKMFLPDRYVEGICPNCGSDKARGDQCDNCGAYYDQTELKEPVSTVTGKTPIVKETTHWFFKFGEFQKFLEDYIKSHESDWKENVIQQTRSWLKQGLSERAITRDLNWGVKINGIEGVDREKAKGKVIYVWFEAVLGYISATKELVSAQESDYPGSKEDWKKWWQDDDTRYIAFIGKDNIVFHTLIFPAILHAMGGYNLPDNVPANEFLNLEGKKLSKSRNWSIDVKDFLKDFPEAHDIDALRYTLAMNLPETRDSDFTWKDFQARNNNELADIFGNLVNRTLTFIYKNFSGKIPVLSEKYRRLPVAWNNLVDYLDSQNGDNLDNILNNIPDKYTDGFDENDLQLILALWKGVQLTNIKYRKFRFRDAVTETMNIARSANKYFNDEQPWRSKSSDPEACAKALYCSVQIIRSLSILFAPIIPYTCRRINRMLDLDICIGNANYSRKGNNLWHVATSPTVEEGHKIAKPGIIFTKVEDKVIEKQIEKLGSQPDITDAQKDPQITIDDFGKIKLRTAKIIEAEAIKKSKKLLKLQVSLGNGDRRQIIAGIAQHYNPEELIGKTIVVVANLKPAKLMGERSEGMLLAANMEDGRLCIVSPEKDDVPSGAEVR